jgi:hypothetical protein
MHTILFIIEENAKTMPDKEVNCNSLYYKELYVMGCVDGSLSLQK